MPPTIREMNAADLRAGFLETLGTLSPVDLNPDQALEVFRQRLRAGLRTYVAILHGRVVGTLTLLLEQKFIHQGGKVGHIEDVVVAPDFRGQGIGQALVQFATDQAEREGCYKVILNCREDRVPFYERARYHRHDVGMRTDLAPKKF